MPPPSHALPILLLLRLPLLLLPQVDLLQRFESVMPSELTSHFFCNSGAGVCARVCVVVVVAAGWGGGRSASVSRHRRCSPCLCAFTFASPLM